MYTETSVQFNWRSPFDLKHPAGGMLSGIVAGLIAGVIIGIGARIVMRIIALALGASPIFTINGTLVILKNGAIFGIMFGTIFGFFQPFYKGSIIKKGVKYGLFLSALMVMVQYANREAFAEAPLPVILPLFAVLSILYGLMLGWVIIRLIPRDQKNGDELAQTMT